MPDDEAQAMKLPGIYIEIKADTAGAKQELRKVETVVKGSSAEMSKALDGALSGRQVSNSINSLVKNLRKVQQGSTLTANDFKQVERQAELLGREIGVTDTYLAKLQARMLQSKAEAQSERAFKSLTRQMSLNRSEQRELAAQLGLTSAQQKKLFASVDSGSGKVSALGGAFKTAGLAMAAYFSVQGISSLTAAVWESGKSMEATRKAYENITGSAAGAAQEFAFLRTAADDLGQNFYDLLPAYKQIAAASRGTTMEGQATRDIFTAVGKASADLGLSAEQTTGALNAISQMMSKGNVQAEELRGQLGERIPGAFNDAAEAMGMTTEELNKALEGGEVLATDLLPRLAKLWGEKYAGSVSEAVRSQNKWNEAIEDAKVALADSGFISVAATAMNELADAIARTTYFIRDLTGSLGQDEQLAKLQKQAEHYRDTISEIEEGGVSWIESWGFDKYASLLKETEEQISAITAKTAAAAEAATLRATANRAKANRDMWDKIKGFDKDGREYLDKEEAKQAKKDLDAQNKAVKAAEAKAAKETEKAVKAAAEQAAKVEKITRDATKKRWAEREKIIKQHRTSEQKLAEKFAKQAMTIDGRVFDSRKKELDAEYKALKAHVTDQRALDIWYAQQRLDIDHDAMEEKRDNAESFSDYLQAQWALDSDQFKTEQERRLEDYERYNGYMKDAVRDLGDYTTGYMEDQVYSVLKGQGTNFANFWSGMWDSMLQSMSKVVVDMAATAATNQLMNLGGYLVGQLDFSDLIGGIFHSGALDIKDDELLAKLQAGEMVVPAQQAEIIRTKMAERGASGDFFGDLAGMVSAQVDSGRAVGTVSGDTARDIATAAVRESALGAMLTGYSAYGRVQDIGRAYGIDGAVVDRVAFDMAVDKALISGIANMPAKLAGGLLNEILGTSSTTISGTSIDMGDIGSVLLGAAKVAGGFSLPGFAVGVLSPLVGLVADFALDGLDARNYEAMRDSLEDSLGLFAGRGLATRAVNNMGTVNTAWNGFTDSELVAVHSAMMDDPTLGLESIETMTVGHAFANRHAPAGNWGLQREHRSLWTSWNCWANGRRLGGIDGYHECYGNRRLG